MFVLILTLLMLSFAGYYKQATEIKLLRHQNIANMMQIIKLGYSKEKTEEILLKAKSPNFKLEKINQGEWILSTPLEFGATNWLLVIDFKNDKVASLKVRTSDSMNIKPDSAPNDIELAIQ